jgi:hypothetical protein
MDAHWRPRKARMPTDAHGCPQAPTNAHMRPRMPTAAHGRPRPPTAAHGRPRPPTAAHRRPPPPTAPSEGSQNAPNALPMRSQCAPNALPMRSQYAPNALPERSQCAPNTLPIRSQYASNTLPIRSQYAPNTVPIRSQYAPNTLPIRSQYAPNTVPIRSQYALNTLPVRSQYAPNTLPMRSHYRLELKAATPRTERTWRRSVTPIWAVKPHRRAELRYEFAAHTSSFMTNAWQPGSKGCHILVFAAWEEGSWEFWPVPLRAPLLGVPGRRSPAGQRLWSSSWEGPKSRLDEHFGAQGNLPLRCESWALDVHEAVAAKATQPAPTARRRAAPAPDGLALAREFLSKRGRKA